MAESAGAPPRVISLREATDGSYRPGRPVQVLLLWILVEWALVSNSLQLSSRVRVWALRRFGAQIGSEVIMRPRIRVKCPWRLSIGDHCWIGEGVWIHNQDDVSIGADTVLSQETFVTTGSHDSTGTMDLVVAPVRIGRGVWITSRCIVLQGVDIGDNALVLPGSTVSSSLTAGGVHGGQPARFVRARVIGERTRSPGGR